MWPILLLTSILSVCQSGTLGGCKKQQHTRWRILSILWLFRFQNSVGQDFTLIFYILYCDNHEYGNWVKKCKDELPVLFSSLHHMTGTIQMIGRAAFYLLTVTWCLVQGLLVAVSESCPDTVLLCRFSLSLSGIQTSSQPSVLLH